jgi:hypothetical protein
MQRRRDHGRACAGWAAAVLAMMLLAIAPAPQASASSGCRAPTRHPFPAASGLRASHTDCATARAVVEYVQAWWQLHAELPGWLKAPVRHHRWHCTYRSRGTASRKSARCSSGRRLVTLTLG